MSPETLYWFVVYGDAYTCGLPIRILVQSAPAAGAHTIRWDGRDDEGRSVASGVYLYQLKADENVATKKSMLLK